MFIYTNCPECSWKEESGREHEQLLMWTAIIVCLIEYNESFTAEML